MKANNDLRSLVGWHTDTFVIFDKIDFCSDFVGMTQDPSRKVREGPRRL